MSEYNQAIADVLGLLENSAEYLEAAAKRAGSEGRYKDADRLTDEMLTRHGIWASVKRLEKKS